MTSPSCVVARRVPGSMRAPRVRRHAGSCLRCQAEMARRHRLQRRLRALRHLVEPAPAGFTAAVLTALDDRRTPDVSRGTTGRRVATGGAVLAAAVGAAVVALRRGRPVVG